MNAKWQQAFEKMAEKASQLEITGVMAIAKKETNGKISMELQDCGKEFDDWGNFYSIACAKIMQMIRTGEDSGTNTILVGEYSGYTGGTLNGEYYVTFSGAEGEIDLKVAKVGLGVLMSE